MKRRINLAAALALVLSLALLAVASAHAELVSSTPAAGAKLTAAPSKVTLVFSEEISDQETDSNFTVADASGATVGTGKLDTNDLDHKTMSGTLKAGLGDGVYTVKWNALTTDDNGHSEGQFSFGVNVDPAAGPTATPRPAVSQPATAAPQPTAAPSQPTATPHTHDEGAAGAGAPGNLPKTGASGADMRPALLLALALVLAGGLLLRRGLRGSRR